VTLEGDALQVVHALRKDGRNWSWYGHIVEDTRDALNCLHKWNVNHVKRTLNGLAHRLAKKGLSMLEEQCS
jgi:hypothetical protein